MEINGIEPIGGITSNPVDQGEITEEVFLKLLSTQLQYQDPLEPAEDVEFIQQMATFAQLEQQRITNDNLQVVQLYESSINNSNALNIVGKDVKILDNSFDHNGEGQSHTVFYDSDSQAARVKVRVLDSDGREVYSSTQIGAEDGEQEYTWFGVDNEGNPVPEGDYTIKITLEDGEGQGYPANIFQTRRVDGISYKDGAIWVLVGDRRMPIENVIEVFEPTSNGGGGFLKTPAGEENAMKNGVAGSQVAAGLNALAAGKNKAYQALPGFGQATHSGHALLGNRQPLQLIPGGRY